MPMAVITKGKRVTIVRTAKGKDFIVQNAEIERSDASRYKCTLTNLLTSVLLHSQSHLCVV